MSTRSVSSQSPRQVLLRQSRAVGSGSGVSASAFVASKVPLETSVLRCSSSVASREVAFAYGRSPRDVLQSTFRALRKVARSNQRRRIAERLATQAPRIATAAQDAETPDQSEWRSLRDVVGDVLRKIDPQVGPARVRRPAGLN